MRSSRQFRSFRSYPDALPFGVKWLLISNIVVFFLSILFPERVIGYFHLDPDMLVHRFAIWQLVTYMFLHGGILHILFNMLTLYWFGPDLERTWGTPRFLKFYFICGVGAGICFAVVELFSPVIHTTIGASGAIYGILMAYGMLFPDRVLLGTVALICSTPGTEPTGAWAPWTVAGWPSIVSVTLATGFTTPEIRLSSFPAGLVWPEPVM